MTITCASCRFAMPLVENDTTSDETAFCYRYPPELIDKTSAAYPPVALKKFWCGEHKPAAPKKPAAIQRRTTTKRK